MEKIPTLFERDWEGNRSRVINEINPEAVWLLDSKIAVCTEKIDGSSCLIRDGVFYARYMLRDGKESPEGFIPADEMRNGKQPGWRPVDEDNPADKHHRSAFFSSTGDDGSYELVGPKVQGNPYGLREHQLWGHTSAFTAHNWVKPEWDAVRTALEAEVVEGLVWQQLSDAGEIERAVKIKRRDFGLLWPPKTLR